jgi:inner membrane protein
MESVFDEALHSQGLAYRRLLAQPSPLNNLLWRGVAETDAGYWIGFHSLMDNSQTVSFHFVSREDQLLDGVRHQPDVRKLLLKSNGWYRLNRRDGALVFNDMRFGSFQEWQGGAGDSVFAFRIEAARDDPDLSILTRLRPDFQVTGNLFRQYLDRVFGRSRR